MYSELLELIIAQRIKWNNLKMITKLLIKEAFALHVSL